MDHFHRLYIFRIIQALLADKHHLAGFLNTLYISRQSAHVIAIDFSQKTCFPACKASIVICACSYSGVAIMTACYISIIQKASGNRHMSWLSDREPKLFQVGRIIITQGNHIGIRNRLQVIQMVLSTRTCTDKSDPHLFLCDCTLSSALQDCKPKRGKQHTASPIIP